MANEKLPHMPLFVYDIEADEQCSLMTNEQYGVYIRLLQRQWIEGSIPDEPAKLAHLLRLPLADFARLWESVKAKFTPTDDGRLANEFYGRVRNKILTCKRMPTVFDQFDTNIERRRERERAAGPISKRLRMEVYRRDCYECRICGSTDNLSIDHIEPISRGGLTEFDNLQVLCRSCNARKGAR